MRIGSFLLAKRNIRLTNERHEYNFVLKFYLNVKSPEVKWGNFFDHFWWRAWCLSLHKTLIEQDFQIILQLWNTFKHQNTEWLLRSPILWGFIIENVNFDLSKFIKCYSKMFTFKHQLLVTAVLCCINFFVLHHIFCMLNFIGTDSCPSKMLFRTFNEACVSIWKPTLPNFIFWTFPLWAIHKVVKVENQQKNFPSEFFKPRFSLSQDTNCWYVSLHLSYGIFSSKSWLKKNKKGSKMFTIGWNGFIKFFLCFLFSVSLKKSAQNMERSPPLIFH